MEPPRRRLRDDLNGDEEKDEQRRQADEHYEHRSRTGS